MCIRQNLVVSLVLVISMVGVSYGAGGNLPGDGLSESTAYRIEDLADFDEFAGNSSYWASGVYTKLTCDINLTGKPPYTTAVIAPDGGSYFEGIFDGNGHIISNLTIDTAGAGNDYLGLFGQIEGSGAEVKNLGLENINITGGNYSDYLGSLCASNSGTIGNCYATGAIIGDERLGGLCASNSGTITNCYTACSIVGGADSYSFGGLCAFNNGTITNCYATCSVTGGDDSRHLGGLCAFNNGIITNCYATGSVTGGDNSSSLGGLCGYNEDTITNCYATGAVTGADWLGGLCGYNGGTITNCYATGPVTGGGYLGGLCGCNADPITNCYFYLLSGPDNGLGTALDNIEMQEAGSFVGFDFADNSNDGQDDYWTIVDGYCPKLTWQTDDGPLVPSPPVTTLSGSGYSYNPFQINSYADFTEFRTNGSLRCGYYILTIDIDLSGETFTTAVINGVFGGHFDGNGHVIRNITIDTAGADNDYLGLFSTILASVSDLGIENINIIGGTGSGYLGGLCGYNAYGTITNCYATGAIIGDDRLGGLCASNSGTITNCYTACSIVGGADSYSFGGLCASNYGTITNCYATGSVTGGDDSRHLGGLCASNYGTITNCYTIGAVTGGVGSWRLGGLCGYNSYGTITNCYANGLVTGGDYSGDLGGLCGYNGSVIITNCFWDVETSGMTDGVGNQDPDPDGVIGKTTAQMQTQSTFTNESWDFVGEDVNGTDDFWRMCVDGIDYPKLSWQFLAGDFACRDGVDLIDFAVLAETWWLSSGQAGYNELCDLVDDDTIDLNDLAVFVENWLAGK